MKKLYVTMTDKFMSGWGKAEGKINKFVVECDNWQQAEIIERNAKKRSEMKHININTRKPSGSKYLVSLRSFDELGAIWKA
jgi:hypothetical protein